MGSRDRRCIVSEPSRWRYIDVKHSQHKFCICGFHSNGRLKIRGKSIADKRKGIEYKKNNYTLWWKLVRSAPYPPSITRSGKIKNIQILEG